MGVGGQPIKIGGRCHPGRKHRVEYVGHAEILVDHVQLDVVLDLQHLEVLQPQLLGDGDAVGGHKNLHEKELVVRCLW